MIGRREYPPGQGPCQLCAGRGWVTNHPDCSVACASVRSSCPHASIECPLCSPDPFLGLYGQHDGESRPPRAPISIDDWTARDRVATDHMRYRNRHPRKAAPMAHEVPARPAGLDQIRRSEMDDLVTRFRLARNASAPIILTAREAELVADVFDLMAGDAA